MQVILIYDVMSDSEKKGVFTIPAIAFATNVPLILVEDEIQSFGLSAIAKITVLNELDTIIVALQHTGVFNMYTNRLLVHLNKKFHAQFVARRLTPTEALTKAEERERHDDHG